MEIFYKEYEKGETEGGGRKEEKQKERNGRENIKMEKSFAGLEEKSKSERTFIHLYNIKLLKQNKIKQMVEGRRIQLKQYKLITTHNLTFNGSL